ncbi:nucleoside-diphosphate sugar epimerase/dehydratase [Humibacter antri]
MNHKLFSERVRVETARRGSSLAVRFGSQVVIDGLSWIVAVLVAIELRYDGAITQTSWPTVVVLCAVLVVVQAMTGAGFSLYRGRYTYGSFEEVRALLYTVLITALICGIPLAIIGTYVGLARSIVFGALPFAFVLMGAVRYVKRLYVEKLGRPGVNAKPTLVYGAGEMGANLVRRMLADKYSSLVPVGIIDDDPAVRARQLRGVPVQGTGEELAAIAERTGAEVLIVAVARADAKFLRTAADKAAAAGLEVKVLPTLDEVLMGKRSPADIRDIAIEDLIGRHPVETDVASIAGYITDRRVLVTGAGGSIGSELCRQISRFGPRELIMLDRDETGLQGTQLSVFGHGLLNTPDVVLADIRDSAALGEIFTHRRPEVVFHAAALKHLPMLAQYPDEAWKTNVLGTLNVLRAAMDAGTTVFVNISTDKAANPTSVLGHSKRVGEKLTAWAAERAGVRYLSVRFGNVIGSRGSMLPTFQSLIESGGPLTITHPDVTRYFMTIPEACQLVVQAGGIGEPGEVLILDMGEPVRILDIAERMIATSGKDIEIVFTGLRDGEKLHEDLVGIDESDMRPKHPKISHTRIMPMAPDLLDHVRWEHRLRTNGADTAVLDRVAAHVSAGTRTLR